MVLASSSVGLFSDMLHNVADALTAVPIWLAFIVGRRLPTKRFSYGYGRAEDLAGLAVLAFIAGSSVIAAYEAIDRLLHPAEVKLLWAVAIAGVVGFVGNELVARYRITTGRAIGSGALVADGLHARADGFTSLAVVAGAAGVALGFPAADPVAGLIIAGLIIAVLKDAARDVLMRIMDGVDPSIIDASITALRTVPGVEDVGAVRCAGSATAFTPRRRCWSTRSVALQRVMRSRRLLGTPCCTMSPISPRRSFMPIRADTLAQITMPNSSTTTLSLRLRPIRSRRQRWAASQPEEEAP